MLSADSQPAPAPETLPSPHPHWHPHPLALALQVQPKPPTVDSRREEAPSTSLFTAAESTDTKVAGPTLMEIAALSRRLSHLYTKVTQKLA